MRRLSISAAWDESKGIFARDGQLVMAVALALIVLPQVVLAVVGAPVGSQATYVGRLIYFAVICLGFAAQIAIVRLAIGPSVTVGEAIGQGLRRLPPVFLVLVVTMFAMAVVVGILMIPLGAAGLTVMQNAETPSPIAVVMVLVLMALIFPFLQLVLPVAAIETGNPLRLWSRSWELGRSQYLRLLAFVIIIIVGFGLAVLITQIGISSAVVLLLGKPSAGSMSALLIGLLAGIIQAAFTSVTAVMLARIYVQLAGRGEVEAGVPSSGI